MSQSCPCGSLLSFSNCCEPVLTGKKLASSAEALMRARYTAFAVGEIGFLKNSFAPEKRDEFDENSVTEWSKGSKWLGFEILKSEPNKVEFVAKYSVQGKVQEHHEIAEFRKDEKEGRWYFVDSVFPKTRPIVRQEPKLGRNDPCACGSGKKFKKCCSVAGA